MNPTARHGITLLFLLSITCFPAILAERLPANQSLAREQLWEAKKKYEKASAKRNKQAMAKALYATANAYMEMNRFSDALKDIKKALKTLPAKMHEKKEEASMFLLAAKAEKEINQLESARAHLDKALLIFNTLHDSSGIADCYSQMGSISWKGREFGKATSFFQKAFACYKNIKDPDGTGLSLINLGVVAMDTKNYPLAAQFFSEAYSLYKENHDSAGLGNVLHHSGNLYYRSGDYTKAIDCYHQALCIRALTGDPSGAASTHLNLGMVYRDQGNTDSASAECNRAIQLAERAKDSALLAAAYSQGGSVLLRSSRFVKAHEYFLKSLMVSLAISDSMQTIQAYTNLGSLFAHITNYDKSIEYFNKALLILKNTPNVTKLAYVLNQTGNSYYTSGAFKNALKYYEKALDISTNAGDRQSSAIFLKNAGRAEAMLGNKTKALQLLDESIQINKAGGKTNGVIQDWNEKGNIFQQYGDMMAATHCFDSMVYLARIEPDLPLLALGLRKLGDAIMEAGNNPSPESFFKESLTIGEKLSNEEIIRNALWSLSRYYEKVGNNHESLKTLQRYIVVNDSMLKHRNNQAIILAQANFEISQKDKELRKVSDRIDLLEKEQTLSDLANSRQRNVIRLLVTASLLTFFLILLVYNRYRLKKKAASLLEEKYEITRASNQRLSESEQHLRILNQTKDKFFSIIAHDIRNPLAGLLGLSDHLLKASDELDKTELKEVYTLIHESARNLYDLLDNLLQWARSQTGTIAFRPESFDLSQVVGKTLKLLSIQAAEKHIRLTSAVPTETYITGDANMVTVIVRNLLSNACKFTPEGGMVYIESHVYDHMTEITVKDSGVGMNQEKVKKLFKIDEHVSTPGTKNEKGSGLGLILCKEFIEKNGGTIRVESEEGKGSMFIFTLPSGKG